MRAAVLSSYGEAPRAADRDEPAAADGEAVIELLAAALNPADLAIASGTFPAGSPTLPYVPGIEGVGRVVESARFAPGTRVWASGRGLGVAADGSFSERFVAAEAALYPVPDDADDIVAAALGQVGLAAWVPLTWLAPVREREVVLVLGATGNVGTVAVQAARLLGAGRIVGVGRDEARLTHLTELGADATVALGGEGFRERLAAACEGASPTLVVDTLWAEPVEAAAAAAGQGARFVHLGQSAGPSATLASGLVRGKQLQILGYSNFAVPGDVLARGYAEVVGHAAAGRIRLATRAVALEQVDEAWESQRSTRDAKIVLVPGS
jgi:NADPH2:quinone reductase